MFSFLTPDQSTLFSWTLSDSIVPPKRGSAINDSSSILAHSKTVAAMFQGPKSGSGSTRTKSTVIPSLTGGASRPSASSILTDKIKVISHQPSDQVKVKLEAQADVISLSDGGLSDNDELGGTEREAAINSPPKGKKRITSEVKSWIFLIDCTCLILSLSSNSYFINPQRRQANQRPRSPETKNFQIGLKLNGSATPMSQLTWHLSVKQWTLGTFPSNSPLWCSKWSGMQPVTSSMR